MDPSIQEEDRQRLSHHASASSTATVRDLDASSSQAARIDAPVDPGSSRYGSQPIIQTSVQTGSTASRQSSTEQIALQSHHMPASFIDRRIPTRAPSYHAQSARDFPLDGSLSNLEYHTPSSAHYPPPPFVQGNQPTPSYPYQDMNGPIRSTQMPYSYQQASPSNGEQELLSLAGPPPHQGVDPSVALAMQLQQQQPPGYHTHDFPATPPALDFASRASPFANAFEKHLNLDDAVNPPPDHPPPPIDAASENNPAFAGRFPRWRGWLEKRALERHYARMDAAAASGSDTNAFLGVPQPRRKKSWGTGVNDPDALSEDETESSDDEESLEHPDRNALPSLHLHQHGSRFIPHLHSQPLCSVIIELPPPPLRGAAYGPRLESSRKKRQVILIGTADGLFAFQKANRKPKKARPGADRYSSSSSSNNTWNDDLRCIHIWCGLGIYQMCILASAEQSSFNPLNMASNKQDKGSSGILLALTAPVPTSHTSFLSAPLLQLSAQAGAVFENVAASGIGAMAGSSNSSHGHGSNIHETTDSIPAANFGCSAGGGPGRAVPPSGTGVVRMWNLEAIKKVVLYALDHEAPHLPLDLVGERTASKEKKNKLGTMLKRAFAKERLSGDKANKKDAVLQRRSASEATGGIIDPLSLSPRDANSRRGSPRPYVRGYDEDSGTRSPTSSDFHGSSRRGSMQSSRSAGRSAESLGLTNSRDDAENVSLFAKDPDLAATMALALSSVPINTPSSSSSSAGSGGAHSQGSYASLFGDDVYGPSTTKHSQAKGKDKETANSAAGRGILFFTVHEAGADTKGTGTWYLALATTKSVIVYEALPPKRGGVRSWTWMKELYAPFAVKAIAFAPCSVADDADPHAPGRPFSSAALGSGPASTKLKVSSANAPLSAAPKGSGQSATATKRSYSSILKPYHPLSNAAPASWHGADLCVFVSFGRRSVLIRLSDSNVREFELMPLTDVIAASGGPASMLKNLALLPQSALPVESNWSKERQRPRSAIALSASLPPHIGHVRHGSTELKYKDGVGTEPKLPNKHNWVGFSSLEARIRVRQHRVDSESMRSSLVRGTGQPELPPLPMQAGSTSRLAPSGQILRNPSSTLSHDSRQREKALPQIPPRQNLSFDRRESRVDMDLASRAAYEAVQAEMSSDEDGEEFDDLSVNRAQTRTQNRRGYSLHDRAMSLDGSAGATPGASSQGSRLNKLKPKRQGTLDAAKETNTISAKVALLSRGSITQILPLPLPADMARPAPLGALQWSDTPNSVSGWARILGVERAMTSGPIAMQAPPSPRGRMVSVHVGVTALAFLPSKIETKHVSFKMDVPVDFDLRWNAELELVPQAHSTRQAPSADIELEYLCGSLITLPPVDLDARAAGAEAAVPTEQDRGLEGHYGDGGVIAFDWRGAEDYRIFSVGTRG